MENISKFSIVAEAIKDLASLSQGGRQDSYLYPRSERVYLLQGQEYRIIITLVSCPESGAAWEALPTFVDVFSGMLDRAIVSGNEFQRISRVSDETARFRLHISIGKL